MNKGDATALVYEYLRSLPISNTDDEYVIVDEMTVEKSYGWIFRFNSRVYIETENIMYALGGNGPIVVLKSTGELRQLSSAVPGEQAVKEFESNMGLSI